MKKTEVVQYNVELLKTTSIGKELNSGFLERMGNAVEGKLQLQLDCQKKSIEILNSREVKTLKEEKNVSIEDKINGLINMVISHPNYKNGDQYTVKSLSILKRDKKNYLADIKAKAQLEKQLVEKESEYLKQSTLLVNIKKKEKLEINRKLKSEKVELNRKLKSEKVEITRKLDRVCKYIDEAIYYVNQWRANPKILLYKA
jgi:hypothetical protein